MVTDSDIADTGATVDTAGKQPAQDRPQARAEDTPARGRLRARAAGKRPARDKLRALVTDKTAAARKVWAEDSAAALPVQPGMDRARLARSARKRAFQMGQWEYNFQ